MERRTAFAVIGATTGVLMSTSIAAVAIVNAMAGATELPAEAVVADPGAIPASAADAVLVAAPGPSFAPGALPEVVLPSIAPPLTSAPLVAAAPTRVGQPPVRSGRTVATTPTPSPTSASASSRPSPQASTEPRSLTIAEAKAIVLAQVPGAFVSAKETERGGYEAIAVTVQRADGSQVTGYVEASSGVVFDWVQTEPPAPAPQAPAAQSASGEHDDDDDRDDHDDDHRESEEHEKDEDD